MQDDLLAINAKFDPKIADLEERLANQKALKQNKREKIMRYYAALEKKAEIDVIIQEGKPVI